MAAWTNFVWPRTGTPGVRISGIGTDGKPYEFLNEPGRFGLEKMLTTAQRRKLPDGSFELTWTSGGVSVTMQLRLIASPTTGSGSSAGNDTPSASGGLRGVQLPALVVGAAAAPAGPAPGATAANGGRP